ncbi:MAG: antibiotic biosynthesis monooxygenase [Acidobacteriota bacterium]|nr:MAG: antibiotic biosynthesis monooxygenase [Acidobacteriota bacterium]
MVVACVHVRVKEEHVEDFIAESRLNHLGSVQEDGNFRFDVCQSQTDPTVFLLYEAYTSQEAAARHKETPHYLRWRDRVADWMAVPRTADKYRILAPEK